KAGMQAVASATVVGTVNHQGNVGRALEDMAKPEGLRAIATSILTAGFVENVTQTLKLPDAPKTFGEHVQKAAIKAAISLPVNATLGGVDPDKALGMAAISTAANTLGGFAATKIGQAYGAESLSYAEHKALHAGLGAITGAILDPKNPGKGAAAGALGAVIGETVAEWQLGLPQLLENKEHLRQENLPTREHTETAHNLALLSAASAALLTKQDVGIATHTANTAVEHNNKLVLKGLEFAAKKSAFLWKKGKDWLAKRAAKEAKKETAQKSAKGVAKELQKPQKTIGKREGIRKTTNTENLTREKISQTKDVFKHRYKYHLRIRERSLQDPTGHNFPYSFDDIILKVKPIIQKDGSLLYRAPGVLGNKKGYFEMAINPRTETIFHRVFVRK
ncbi:MAG: DUF637 domain-containing protein, partial [Alphaproteobacteria bacterium]